MRAARAALAVRSDLYPAQRRRDAAAIGDLEDRAVSVRCVLARRREEASVGIGDQAAEREGQGGGPAWPPAVLAIQKPRGSRMSRAAGRPGLGVVGSAISWSVLGAVAISRRLFFGRTGA
jgi:hypothetical protein